MAGTLGVYLPEGTLRDAADEARLSGASKSEIVRFAMLSLVMSRKAARNAVFGTDLTETDGRVNSYVPPGELERVRDYMKASQPDLSISQVARFALAKLAGDTDDDARAFALSVRRGRPPRKDCNNETCSTT